MKETSPKNLVTIVRENKTLFIIIAVALFLIELEIFAVAAIKSGKKSTLQVFDKTGNLIHETDGKNLCDFNKYYFEKTFGPLQDYQVKLVTKDAPFPFRAWFTAAVGIPLGIILLFAFIVKAFATLFYDRSDPSNPARPSGSASGVSEHATAFEKVITGLSSFNVFILGFLALMAVLAYWIVPNLIIYIGKTGVETISRYKWALIIAGTALFGVLLWIIYLKYLLAKKSIDSQTEIDKYRLQLEYTYSSKQQTPQIAYDHVKLIENTEDSIQKQQEHRSQ